LSHLVLRIFFHDLLFPVSLQSVFFAIMFCSMCFKFYSTSSSFVLQDSYSCSSWWLLSFSGRLKFCSFFCSRVLFHILYICSPIVLIYFLVQMFVSSIVLVCSTNAKFLSLLYSYDLFHILSLDLFRDLFPI
jgi:hypothetical protein